jgi:hypothetical protein
VKEITAPKQATRHAHRSTIFSWKWEIGLAEGYGQCFIGCAQSHARYANARGHPLKT